MDSRSRLDSCVSHISVIHVSSHLAASKWPKKQLRGRWIKEAEDKYRHLRGRGSHTNKVKTTKDNVINYKAEKKYTVAGGERLICINHEAGFRPAISIIPIPEQMPLDPLSPASN